jgi:outer membrane protein OmpA-like peptidoglycan-associated protein
VKDVRALVVSCCALAAAGAGVLLPGVARAQQVGFQLNRHEPTPAGSWTFMVDHPWYSRTRTLAAGLTLNYGHNPLVFGLRRPDGAFERTDVVIAHHLLLHVDVAMAFWDRVNVSLTLPVTALEQGQAVGAVSPIDGGALGDPRLGLLFRLYGQPDEDPFSLSLGGSLWFPIGASARRAGDAGARVLPRLIAGGLIRRRLRWSASGGFYYRPEAQVAESLSDPRGGALGPSLQLGAHMAYADLDRRFSIGPELLLHTTVTEGRAFSRDGTSLEVLLGAQHNIAKQVQAGVAVGLGALRDPGTPDVRLLVRLAYAPFPERKPAAAPRACPPAPPCPRCELSPAPPPPAPPSPPAPPPEKPCLLPLLSPIHFDTDKDDPMDVKDPLLRSRNIEVLRDVARQIQERPEIRRLRISGHTDSRGKPAHNKDLSRRRAEHILRWLTEPGKDRGGIAADRLGAEGFGMERPIAPNASPEGRQRNRRVEFEVLDAPGCRERPRD